MVSAVGCRQELSAPAPNVETARALRQSSGGAADAGVAAAPTGEGWGSLTGRFVLAGDIPAAAFVSTSNKDGEVCGARVADLSLLVDSANKGVANVVVFARKASRVHDSVKDVPADSVVFDQKVCLFLTHVLPVRARQQILIKNSDPVAHNTNITPPGDAAFNANLPGGGETTYKFSKEQLAPVSVVCSIHPWMRAYIFPRKDPYLAVTAADGSFKIENLPAGEELEFQVWHERSKKGGFAAARPDLSWTSAGRFKVKLSPDEARDLGTIEIPAGTL
jgi:hypothetical protein